MALAPHTQRLILEAASPDDTAQTVSIRYDRDSQFASNEIRQMHPALAEDVSRVSTLLRDYTAKLQAAINALPPDKRDNDDAVKAVTDSVVDSIDPADLGLILDVLSDTHVEILDNDIDLTSNNAGFTRVLSTRRSHVITNPGDLRSIHESQLSSLLDRLVFHMTGIHHVDGEPETPPPAASNALIDSIRELSQSRTRRRLWSAIDEVSLISCQFISQQRVPPRKPETTKSDADVFFEQIEAPAPDPDIVALERLGYDEIAIREMEDIVRQDILKNRIRAAKHIVFPGTHVPWDPLARITPPDYFDWVKPDIRLPSGSVGICFRSEIMHVLVPRNRKPQTPRELVYGSNNSAEGGLVLDTGTSIIDRATIRTHYSLMSRLLTKCPDIDFIDLADLIEALQQHNIYSHRTFTALRQHVFDTRFGPLTTITQLDALELVYALATMRCDMHAVPFDQRSPLLLQRAIDGSNSKPHKVTRASVTEFVRSIAPDLVRDHG